MTAVTVVKVFKVVTVLIFSNNFNTCDTCHCCYSFLQLLESWYFWKLCFFVTFSKIFRQMVSLIVRLSGFRSAASCHTGSVKNVCLIHSLRGKYIIGLLQIRDIRKSLMESLLVTEHKVIRNGLSFISAVIFWNLAKI